jgi:S-adenosylmethionine uptake transporter
VTERARDRVLVVPSVALRTTLHGQFLADDLLLLHGASLSVEVPPAPPERPLLALAFALGASLGFAAMGAFVRALGHSVGTAETVCARGIVGSIVLLAIHAARRQPIRVSAAYVMGLRIVTGTLSLSCYYGAIEGAFADGPGELATANLLLKSAPIWVALGSRVFLGETATRRTWVALAVGIAGTAAALLGPADAPGGRSTVVLGFLSGICAAGAYLSVRKLATREDPLAVVTLFSIGAAVLTAPFAVFHLARAPDWPPTSALGPLVGAALSGTLAQVLMTHAYRHARATVVAVAGLAEVGFALAASLFIFGEHPTVLALTGGGLAVVAGFVASWPRRPTK